MSDYGLWRAIGGSVEWNTDGTAKALKTLDYPHHEVHEGNSYSISASATKNAAEIFDIVIKTPATKRVHFVGEGSGSGQITVGFYENPTVLNTSKSAITVYNNDRESTNASGVTANTVSSTDVTVAGTALKIVVVGGGLQGRTGGNAFDRTEYLLKQDEEYVIKITSGAASNTISYNANWYEHSS